jgi:hypothetical protein
LPARLQFEGTWIDGFIARIARFELLKFVAATLVKALVSLALGEVLITSASCSGASFWTIICSVASSRASV